MLDYCGSRESRVGTEGVTQLAQSSRVNVDKLFRPSQGANFFSVMRFVPFTPRLVQPKYRASQNICQVFFDFKRFVPPEKNPHLNAIGLGISWLKESEIPTNQNRAVPFRSAKITLFLSDTHLFAIIL